MKEVSSFRFILYRNRNQIENKSNRIECLYYIGCACDSLWNDCYDDDYYDDDCYDDDRQQQTNARVVSLLLSLPCAYPTSFFKYYE